MTRLSRPAGKKTALWLRARMLQAIRAFFFSQGYLEVETPLRIPSPLPEAHIDAIPSGEWFLQTSPEICMKRLLAMGYERIFQIAKCFRGGERGNLHLPEFTMLEWYRQDADYTQMMEETEDLLTFVAGELSFGNALAFRGDMILLKRPWPRITVREAFARFSDTPLEEALKREIFDEILVSAIEPRLGRNRPTILYDYPISLGSLARAKKEEPAVAERFELYLGGMEIANAFSELTDEKEQRRRFAKENSHRLSCGKTAYGPVEPFLRSLGRIKSAAGIALGIDRLAMVFTQAETIDDVVTFTPEDLEMESDI